MPDIPPNDRWQENPDVQWTKGAQGDGIIGIGLKALGKFALGDTNQKTGLWKKTVLAFAVVAGLAGYAMGAGNTANLGLNLWSTGETDYVDTFNQNMANIDQAVVTTVNAVSTSAFAAHQVEVAASTDSLRTDTDANTQQLIDVAASTTSITASASVQVLADCQSFTPGVVGELCYDSTLQALFIATNTTPGAFAAAGGDFTPVGTVVPFSTTTIPTGWLLADGAQYNVSTEKELFDAIGYQYGGAGAVFNVPDLRSRFLVGHDPGDTDWDNLGETGGSKSHTHDLGGHTHTAGFAGTAAGGAALQVPNATTGGPSGDSGVQSNFPVPYYSLVYMIKARTTAGASAASGGGSAGEEFWVGTSTAVSFPGMVTIGEDLFVSSGIFAVNYTPGFGYWNIVVDESNGELTLNSASSIGIPGVPQQEAFEVLRIDTPTYIAEFKGNGIAVRREEQVALGNSGWTWLQLGSNGDFALAGKAIDGIFGNTDIITSVSSPTYSTTFHSSVTVNSYLTVGESLVIGTTDFAQFASDVTASTESLRTDLTAHNDDVNASTISLRTDLSLLETDVNASTDSLRADLSLLETDVNASTDSLRSDLGLLETDVNASTDSLRTDVTANESQLVQVAADTTTINTTLTDHFAGDFELLISSALSANATWFGNFFVEPHRYYRIDLYISGYTGAQVARIIFNGDNGNNYANEVAQSGQITTYTNHDGIRVARNNSVLTRWNTYEILAATESIKRATFHGSSEGSGAGSAPDTVTGAALWDNTTDGISIFHVNSGNAAISLTSGSTIKIWGHEKVE